MVIGQRVTNKETSEECIVVSLRYGKITVQYNDEFNCIQILEQFQLETI